MATDHQTDPLKAFAEGLNLDAAVRAGPDGAPLLDEADGVELAATFTDVEAAVGAGGAGSRGKGTVYVTTRCVACGCGGGGWGIIFYPLNVMAKLRSETLTQTSGG
jgi:hypothetical protein